MTSTPPDPIPFTFFEARRWPPGEIPTEFLRWLRPGDLDHRSADQSLYTTMPRDGMSGLPRDWWMEPALLFAASSMPIAGHVRLEVNDLLVEEVHVPPSGHVASPMVARRPRGTDLRSRPRSVRLRGPDRDGAGADRFRAIFECDDPAPARAMMVEPNMDPIRALAAELLAAFDSAFPDAASATYSRHLIRSHRHHLASLLELPVGPWTLVGISGPTQIVIV